MPQARRGDRTPKDCTRLLKDSYALTARLTLLQVPGFKLLDPCSDLFPGFKWLLESELPMLLEPMVLASGDASMFLLLSKLGIVCLKIFLLGVLKKDFSHLDWACPAAKADSDTV